MSVALAAGAGLASPVAAETATQHASVGDQLRAARLELAWSGDAFEGEGWQRILSDAERAQFFVVGEQHGGAEIISLAAALHAALAKRGYTHAAMEIGPYSTAKAERLIRSGPGELERYLLPIENAWVYPFLGWKDEVRLAEQYVRLSPVKQALWGLDQEFVGAAPILVELLRPRQKTAAQRSAVAQLAAAAAANPKLLADLRPADLQPVTEAFANDPDALRIIEAYRLSAEIYAPFSGRGGDVYSANLTRENYMKINFAAAFAKAEREQRRAPKVFMKLGGNHAMRGFSASGVPGLAGFLAEWGLPRGFAPLNVMIDCVADTPDPSCKPYFGTDHALYAAASPHKYTVFDLRPLRAQLRTLPGVDVKTRDLVRAFDYYVLIRDVGPAAPLRPRSRQQAPQAAEKTRE